MQPPRQRPGQIYRLVQVVFERSSAIQQKLEFYRLLQWRIFSQLALEALAVKAEPPRGFGNIAAALNQDVFDIFAFMPR